MIEGIEAVLLGVGLLLLLMATGLPVFAAFLLINLLAVGVIMGPAGYGMFANSLYETTTTQSLVTIPLFILMGEILFRSNSVEVLFRSIDTLVGRVRGRQYVLSIVLATVFSTLSGAAMGVAAMLGRSLLPGMIARGYDARLSAGTILAGASLAPLIPPSVLAIIIGTLAGVSIAGLLIAGILPGLMFASIFLAYCFIRTWLNPSLAPEEDDTDARFTMRQKFWALLRVVPFSIIILSVMGLILMGIATPTEAGAMGVIGSLVTAAIYRNLSLRMIGEALASSAKVSAMILPFLLCMFIDQIALMLIVIPIYLPIIAELQFDPIWFWLLFLVNITVGGMTPPFGYTLFALKSAWHGGSLGDVFQAAWPFVLLYILGMIILALVPGLTTILPSMI